MREVDPYQTEATVADPGPAAAVRNANADPGPAAAVRNAYADPGPAAAVRNAYADPGPAAAVRNAYADPGPAAGAASAAGAALASPSPSPTGSRAESSAAGATRRMLLRGPASGAVRAALLLAGALAAFLPASANAADHNEAPGTLADPAADITDVYAWHTADEIVAVLAFAGVTASDRAPVYDEDVLYGVHVDNDGDFEADHDIWVRFGQNGAGEWGVQVQNLPGTAGTVSGPVGVNIDAGDGLQVFAGWREDPFFFDLEGFRNTLQTGTLSFDSDRDSFAGLNVTAIVLEMDRAATVGAAAGIHVWATTARK